MFDTSQIRLHSIKEFIERKKKKDYLKIYLILLSRFSTLVIFYYSRLNYKQIYSLVCWTKCKQ